MWCVLCMCALVFVMERETGDIFNLRNFSSLNVVFIFICSVVMFILYMHALFFSVWVCVFVCFCMHACVCVYVCVCMCVCVCVSIFITPTLPYFHDYCSSTSAQAFVQILTLVVGLYPFGVFPETMRVNLVRKKVVVETWYFTPSRPCRSYRGAKPK